MSKYFVLQYSSSSNEISCDECDLIDLIPNWTPALFFFFFFIFQQLHFSFHLNIDRGCQSFSFMGNLFLIWVFDSNFSFKIQNFKNFIGSHYVFLCWIKPCIIHFYFQYGHINTIKIVSSFISELIVWPFILVFQIVNHLLISSFTLIIYFLFIKISSCRHWIHWI